MKLSENLISKNGMRDVVGTVLAVYFMAAGLAGTTCQNGHSLMPDETRQIFCDYAGLKYKK